MISIDEASCADVFHYRPPGESACEVWVRDGQTRHDQDGWSGVPIVTRPDPPATRDWWAVMRHNAVFFHTPENCPHATPAPVPPAQAGPDLASTIGYDVFGYDVFGYDVSGYDVSGYDRDGYDRDGYDRDGYDRDGYDRDGEDRYGRNRDKPDAAGLGLAELWDNFRPRNRRDKQDEFARHLREMVADPDDIDDLRFCGNCGEPAWKDDLSRAGNGDRICESCWSNWYTCDSCDERFPAGDLTTTLSESEVCDSCLRGCYTWCEYCDGYRHDEDYDHDHDSYAEDCDCESPQQRFAIRNDGSEPLANDTRATVTLPAGTISAEGLAAIRRYLRGNGLWYLSDDLDAVGDTWQTRTGNFAKRLSRRAWQVHQAKLTPEVLSQVGNIARDHSNPVDVTIEVTRDLNQDASYFYHDDSCWWASSGTDYHESRCALKTNGGFGLRSFGQYGGVSGRAWVMPLKLDKHGLVPTFATLEADAFVVFNGYGDLSGYAPARILAHMTGWTYRKIGFTCHPMYVNLGSYLIAPEPVAEQYTDGNLDLSVNTHSSLYEQEQREHSYA